MVLRYTCIACLVKYLVLEFWNGANSTITSLDA